MGTRRPERGAGLSPGLSHRPQMPCTKILPQKTDILPSQTLTLRVIIILNSIIIPLSPEPREKSCYVTCSSYGTDVWVGVFLSTFVGGNSCEIQPQYTLITTMTIIHLVRAHCVPGTLPGPYVISPNPCSKPHQVIICSSFHRQGNRDSGR